MMSTQEGGGDSCFPVLIRDRLIATHRTAASFVGICCKGLLAFFRLVAIIHLLLSTAIAVFSVVVFVLTTKFKSELA